MKRIALSVVLLLCLMLTACGETAELDRAALETNENNSIEESEQISTSISGVVTDSSNLDFPLGMEVNSDSFTGTVYMNSMIANDDIYNFPDTNHITFEPGARSNWHSHGGMVILVTGGVGYYQEEGQPAQIIRKGDVIECAEGVRHWHGAAPDSWFSQIVIWDSGYVPVENAIAEEPVTDEEYENLEAVEYTGRTVTDDNAFMFQRAQTSVNLSTFSGPVYVSSLIGSNNVAAALELHYVVFEQG